MWKITDSFDKDQITNFGNKYLLANGYMGYRGTMEEYGKEELVANTILGLYDQVGTSWREPVNAPNGLSIKMSFENEELSLRTKKPLKHQQELNIYEGLHRRETSFSVEGGQVTLSIERFLSMASVHLMAARGELISSVPITLTLQVGIDGDVWDINGPHLVGTQLCELDETSLLFEAQTNEEKKKLSVGQTITVDGKSRYIKTEKQGFHEYLITLEPNVPFSFDIFSATYNENDGENPTEQVVSLLNATKKEGYLSLKKAHRNIWANLWKKSDIEILGDEEAQIALRYSIYHLLSIAPRHSDRQSIPARGLSGQTYKGAVFWDTEMFMVPFFQRTDPQIARNLLMYRVHTLDGARKKAKSYGFDGAFYAWESQEYGQDATSDYNVTDVFTNRPMRTYFRDKQIHITGDIAYAMWNYYEYTNDVSFLLDGAAEVIFESAKFYVSYSYFKESKNRYELLDVIGPDEYHERVANNAYTNKLAQVTVSIALKVWSFLEAHYPNELSVLLQKTKLEEQKNLLEKFQQLIYVPAPDESTGLIEQFDGYYQLEDTSVATVKSRLLNPQEYWGGAYGVASDTQILKQADVLLLLNLFSSSYDKEVIKRNWAYYEPRTEHGSSLSPCIYAMAACKFDNQEWAYPYFMKTATVDLTGETKQFAGTIYIGGTHPAANGGAWMAAILGFAGLKVTDGQLEVEPKLPSHWEKMKFQTIYQNEYYTIEITQGGQKIWKN